MNLQRGVSQLLTGTARVYEMLREKAINYELRPGAHVNEAALAAELHVSRTPVRAALNRLVGEGLMTVVPNEGFFREPLDIDTIRSLFEVRMAIELLSVRLFCERPSEADEAFHLALARGSRNQEVLRLLGELNGRIRFVRTVAMERPTFRDGAFGEHDAIIDALAARDTPRATDLMTRHIRLTLDDVTVLVREMLVRIYLGDAPVG
jgi:DNA-binding GntR family transcriptional regulator